MAIESGTTVISDRYAFSGMAFTGAKFAMKEASEGETLTSALSSVDEGLPLPDLVIFLTLDETSASNRAGFGTERYENALLQREVARQFSQVVRPFFQNLHGPNAWVDVDASGTVQHVEQLVWDVVEQYLPKSHQLQHPIGKLWVA